MIAAQIRLQLQSGIVVGKWFGLVTLRDGPGWHEAESLGRWCEGLGSWKWIFIGRWDEFFSVDNIEVLVDDVKVSIDEMNFSR